MNIGKPLWLLMFFAGLILTVAGTAYAHQPTFNRYGTPTPQSAFVIEEINRSLALFGTLQDDQSIDYYRLDVPAGHEIDIQLFVPVACERFRPQLAFWGPDVFGQPVSPALGLPPGLFADVRFVSQWGTFFEPSDPAHYYAGPTIDHLAEGGNYYIAVYSTQDRPGTYMLSMGGSEEYSASGDDWREQKSSYDSCEVSEDNYFSRLWQRFVTNGVLLFVPLFDTVLFRR